MELYKCTSQGCTDFSSNDYHMYACCQFQFLFWCYLSDKCSSTGAFTSQYETAADHKQLRACMLSIMAFIYCTVFVRSAYMYACILSSEELQIQYFAFCSYCVRGVLLRQMLQIFCIYLKSVPRCSTAASLVCSVLWYSHIVTVFSVAVQQRRYCVQPQQQSAATSADVLMYVGTCR